MALPSVTLTVTCMTHPSKENTANTSFSQPRWVKFYVFVIFFPPKQTQKCCRTEHVKKTKKTPNLLSNNRPHSKAELNCRTVNFACAVSELRTTGRRLSWNKSTVFQNLNLRSNTMHYGCHIRGVFLYDISISWRFRWQKNERCGKSIGLVPFFAAITDTCLLLSGSTLRISRTFTPPLSVTCQSLRYPFRCALDIYGQTSWAGRVVVNVQPIVCSLV